MRQKNEPEYCNGTDRVVRNSGNLFYILVRYEVQMTDEELENFWFPALAKAFPAALNASVCQGYDNADVCLDMGSRHTLYIKCVYLHFEFPDCLPLEVSADVRKGTPGWMNNPSLNVDFIVFGSPMTGRIIRLSWTDLQTAWQANKGAWMRCKSRQECRGGASAADYLVPITKVQTAIAHAQVMTYTPLVEELKGAGK